MLDGETLARVAAKYDVTPSELAQYNKLGMGRMIFPGQILKVPPPAPPPPPKPETPPPKEDMEVIEYQFIKLKVILKHCYFVQFNHDPNLPFDKITSNTLGVWCHFSSFSLSLTLSLMYKGLKTS